jgi:hypothetical protein
MKKIILSIAAGTALLLGCSKTSESYRFEVQADSNWIATYGPVGAPDKDVNVRGSGNKVIPIKWAPPVCIIISNLEASGTITVSAIKHINQHGGVFSGDEDKDVLQNKSTTSDPTGQTEACTKVN